MAKRFVRFERRTHLVGPLQGAEFTLCGVAYDAGDSEGIPSLQWQESTSTTVTCPDCAKVIRACAGVAVRVRA